jgi:hypothetical protein
MFDPLVLDEIRIDRSLRVTGQFFPDNIISLLLADFKF